MSTNHRSQVLRGLLRQQAVSEIADTCPRRAGRSGGLGGVPSNDLPEGDHTAGAATGRNDRRIGCRQAVLGAGGPPPPDHRQACTRTIKDSSVRGTDSAGPAGTDASAHHVPRRAGTNTELSGHATVRDVSTRSTASAFTPRRSTRMTPLTDEQRPVS